MICILPLLALRRLQAQQPANESEHAYANENYDNEQYVNVAASELCEDMFRGRKNANSKRSLKSKNKVKQVNNKM